MTLFLTQRFVLPLERTTDVEQVMHLRNDALCVSGTCLYRSRQQLVGLEALWGNVSTAESPLIPSFAQKLLRMFNRVAVSIFSLNSKRVNAKTLLLAYKTSCKLFALLPMERNADKCDERVRRAYEMVVTRLPNPRYALSPFYCAMNLAET